MVKLRTHDGKEQEVILLGDLSDTEYALVDASQAAKAVQVLSEAGTRVEGYNVSLSYPVDVIIAEADSDVDQVIDWRNLLSNPVASVSLYYKGGSVLYPPDRKRGLWTVRFTWFGEEYEMAFSEDELAEQPTAALV